MFKSIDTIAKEHTFFNQFDLELTKLLLKNCEMKLVKHTHKLYYQGDLKTQNDSFYIILFGKLTLVRQNEEDQSKRIIGSYQIGKTVGEEAILDKNYTKRQESCIAAQETVVMSIPLDFIRRLRLGMELKHKNNALSIVEKLIACLKRFWMEKIKQKKRLGLFSPRNVELK